VKQPTSRTYKIFSYFMCIVGIAIVVAGAMLIPSMKLNAVIIIAVGFIFLLNGRRWLNYAKRVARMEKEKQEAEGNE